MSNKKAYSFLSPAGSVLRISDARRVTFGSTEKMFQNIQRTKCLALVGRNCALAEMYFREILFFTCTITNLSSAFNKEWVPMELQFHKSEGDWQFLT